MRGVPHLRVQPADHGTAAAGPKRVVGVKAELQVVRAEAGVDELIVLGLRIEHGELAQVAFQREQLGRGMIRTRLAEVGIVRARAPPPRATAARPCRTSNCDC